VTRIGKPGTMLAITSASVGIFLSIGYVNERTSRNAKKHTSKDHGTAFIREVLKGEELGIT
jgi:hypothetical protein